MKKSVITLVVVVVIIAGLIFTAFNGIGSLIQPVTDGVVLGLDLVGGSEITYEAVIPDGTSEDEINSGMESAKTMLQQRLDALGYTEASAYLSNGNRIVVQIPAVDDPEKAVQDLGATAVVTFVDADGTEWLSGSDIADASFEYSATDYTGIATNHVKLTLTAEGQQKLYQATQAVVSRTDGNNTLSIKLDDDVISSPNVNEALNTTGVVITLGSNATAEDAKYLADIISAGKLPFTLTTAKVQTMGASLGEKSLSTSLMAGLIGLILVMIFMVVVYRFMGLVSCISLVTYTALLAVMLSVFHINLSLPGIAGIILTIGMAVDANVVIFERIKEELRLGKTLRYAVDSGYKRAFWAIFDSNITTLIAAVVLLIFGTGTIKGFATTLLISVLASLFTAVVVTRWLLILICKLDIRKRSAYTR